MMCIECNALLGTRKKGGNGTVGNEERRRDECGEEGSIFEVMFNSSGYLLVNRLRVLCRCMFFLLSAPPERFQPAIIQSFRSLLVIISMVTRKVGVVEALLVN